MHSFIQIFKMEKRNKDKVRVWGAESKKIAEKGKKN